MANINFLENKVIEFKKTTGEDSILKNPLIANTLYLLKNIEKWGYRFRRITEVCAKADVKVKFEIRKNGFMVIFYRRTDEELLDLTKKIKMTIPEQPKNRNQKYISNNRVK